jgi:hypothetical protein
MGKHFLELGAALQAYAIAAALSKSPAKKCHSPRGIAVLQSA